MTAPNTRVYARRPLAFIIGVVVLALRIVIGVAVFFVGYFARFIADGVEAGWRRAGRWGGGTDWP